MIAGLSAAAVNEAKGRPAEQPAMLVVSDLEIVSSFVALDEEALSYAKWLTASQLIHLLVPVKERVPQWARGAIQKEMLGVSMAWHPDLQYLLNERGYIFASSANITGDTPIGTAAVVDQLFQKRCWSLMLTTCAIRPSRSPEG